MEVAVQLWVLFAGLGAVLAGLFLIFRQLASQAQDKQDIAQLAASLQSANERLERELRNAILESARGGRQELTQTLGTFQQSLV